MLVTTQVQIVVPDHTDPVQFKKDLFRALKIWGLVKKVRYIAISGFKHEHARPEVSYESL